MQIIRLQLSYLLNFILAKIVHANFRLIVFILQCCRQRKRSGQIAPGIHSGVCQKLFLHKLKFHAQKWKYNEHAPLSWAAK